MPRDWMADVGTQPKIKAKVTAKIERVQPFAIGLNKNGELIWEIQDMPRWQMELIRLTPNWFGDFFTRWIEVKNLQSVGQEFKMDDPGLPSCRAASKSHLNDMRRMYPVKK